MTPALVEAFDLVLFDLDGVVYAGPSALPDVPERVAGVRDRAVAVCFVTNNAARTPATVADHLSSLGVWAEVDDVVTSAQVAARIVAELAPDGAPVLVVGGEGLVEAVHEHGLAPVSRAADGPVAVVQGFHPDVDWRLLAEGAYAVGSGVPWVASNVDRTIPTGHGIAPGNGALIEVIHIATGQRPRAVGKPEPGLFEVAVQRHGAERPLVVGDRLDTDIAGAVAAGYPSLLVLTGVTSFADALRAGSEQRPTYLGWTLQALLEPHAESEIVAGLEASEVRVRCGGWLATMGTTSGRVGLEGDGRPHDGLRALAMAVWSLPSQELVDLDAVQTVAERTQSSDQADPDRSGSETTTRTTDATVDARSA